MLTFEEAMEQPRAGFGLAAVGLESALDERCGALDIPQPPLELRRVAIGGRAGIAVVVRERDQRARNRIIPGMSGGDDGAQDLAIALRVDRQLVLEIPGREGPIRGVVFELDLAALQCLAIGASEDRQ